MRALACALLLLPALVRAADPLMTDLQRPDRTWSRDALAARLSTDCLKEGGEASRGEVAAWARLLELDRSLRSDGTLSPGLQVREVALTCIEELTGESFYPALGESGSIREILSTKRNGDVARFHITVVPSKDLPAIRKAIQTWLDRHLNTARIAAKEKLEPSKARKFEYAAFALTLDETWACREVGYGGTFHGPWDWNGGGVRCHSPSGLFVDVLVDVGMSPADADGHWLVRPLPDGRIDIVNGSLCVNSPPDTSVMYPGPSCRRGDGRLDIFMSFEAGGHVFVVSVGNDKEESEQSIPDLRRVLATFRYKVGRR